MDETVDLGKNESKDTDQDSYDQERDKQAAAKLRQSEALRRLAMEKLRKQQKEKSKEYKAHKKDKMARIRDALNKDVGIGSNIGGGLLSEAATQRYVSYLTKAIRRNYSLPKT